jgi:2-keto-4-pentenoate hydratase/2-oxohepta-3-ene-1,7-dioic acid hydratase in catechol pathway
LKIVRYRHLNSETYGILSQKAVLSLPGLASLFGKTLPLNLTDFVAKGRETVETMEYLMERAERKDVASVMVPLSEVALLSPVAFPGKILCLGLNYFDHAEESNSAIPDEPIIFMKPQTSMIGPNQKIIKPRFVTELDYEGELGIVIGKKGKNSRNLKLEITFSVTLCLMMFRREIFSSRMVSGPGEKALIPLHQWVLV